MNESRDYANLNSSIQILETPLARPIVPYLPPAINQLIQPESEDNSVNEYDAGRVYLAKWALKVDEEARVAARQEYLANHGEGEASSNTIRKRWSDPKSWEEETEVGAFEVLNVDLNYPPLLSTRSTSLSPEKWFSSLDSEGRLKVEVDEIREIIFRGGIDDDIRVELWKFLLGVYPWDSSQAEREYITQTKDNSFFAVEDIPHPDPLSSASSPFTNKNLELMKDILMTYYYYNKDLGYVQGMSDLLAPIFVVMHDEAHAFWAFVGFMERMKYNFYRDQSGIRRQLLTLDYLIQFMDPRLYEHLRKTDALNLFFCFRWILIWFKREFKWDEVLHLWEVLWSDHLSSQFHLFVALAILDKHKMAIVEHLHRFDEILKYVNDLSMTIPIDETLLRAETLFNKFKRKIEILDKKNSTTKSSSNQQQNENHHDGLRKRKDMKEIKDVRKVAKLLGSKILKDILARIKQLRHTNRTQAQIIGPVEEDPEYELIVQANNITVDIDNEILVVHKFIRDHYAKKFPELESLVLNPYDYTRAVKAIGNEMDLTKIDLRSILPSATVMVVTVTGSTTNGQQLTEEENTIVSDACDMVLELDSAKREILEYVDSRMTLIAPNLSAIVGSTTAAKILGQAGGLTALCKMPACNVMLIGTQKKLNTGFSNVTAPRHTGYLYQSELIQRTPTDLRTKAQKIVAAKCTLAARMDRMHESSDGSFGSTLREQIDKKLVKLQEPPPTKAVKPLPVPDEGPKKRRAGKKMKEAYVVTELRKSQNRMAFGVPEDEASSFDKTKGLGLIGPNSGKIRSPVADPRVKAKTPRKQQYMGSSGATSGLSSSLAFTPVQGIELINPEETQRKIKEANDKYFSGGQFLKVGRDKQQQK
ncbi:10638_t:CDS:10 [Entrophospora sp. SA101]|nr:10638_t:CDS:10 [Entrophospora sp. SA101]